MAAAYEFKLPDLGEGLTEGEIARWLVAEGQEIAEDDPLVEIQTDKTTVEIPSPAAGVVSSILVGEGEVVPVGTVLVVIGGDGAATDGAAAPSAAATAARAETPAAADTSNFVAQKHKPSSGRVQATPLVRRLAAELGVELESLSGSGPNGRIVEADVRSAAGGGGTGGEGELVLQKHKVPSLASEGPVSEGHAADAAAAEGRREPVRGVRRRIVEHLTRAHREIPAVTFVDECDFSGVDVKALVPLALQATAASLREFPELNARLEGDEIVYLERYDLGVAVQTEQGLVVPVVRACDSRPLEELAADVARLAEAARAGTLAP
ncbi:MAG TPA: dihydrolipoamide acetyltransferase family protein, partial [Gaiellaceae bacterium]|nr:dihydrolipoamide acetyltransferase family protein [Gaiellaceae bacterium]